MNVNALGPGTYKIQKRDYNSRRAKGGRGNNHEIRMLRVTGRGDSLRYFIDQDIIGAHPCKIYDIDSWNVISKYDGQPNINDGSITITFQDSGGDFFKWIVSDVWGLRNLFDEMPWLRKPFNYISKSPKTNNR